MNFTNYLISNGGNGTPRTKYNEYLKEAYKCKENLTTIREALANHKNLPEDERKAGEELAITIKADAIEAWNNAERLKVKYNLI